MSVVAAAGLGAGVAAAGDVKVGQAKPASRSNPWDVAFGVELMSDYNWRGITLSDDSLLLFWPTDFGTERLSRQEGNRGARSN
jgi:hypothetical protein